MILLHGAWHGSWCWKKVIPLLEHAGVQVLAPNLIGHGDGTTDFRKINLNTYVQQLITLIEQQPAPVILVGHSFAGVVISQVAEIIPEKIKALTYIAAFIPQHQGSLFIEAKHSHTTKTKSSIISDPVQNTLCLDLTDPVRIKNIFLNHCSQEIVDEALYYLQPEPLQPMADKVTLSELRFGSIPKRYIACLQDNAVEIHNQRRMAQNVMISDYIELDCDHSPFFSMPEKLVAALI